MAIVKGVPDIVIYAGGAFAIYYFFIREDPDKAKAKRRLVSDFWNRISDFWNSIVRFRKSPAVNYGENSP